MQNSTKHNALAQFHPAIRNWFSNQFEAPTPPQVMGWPVIHQRENVLILAPTGSGKTLAAFLECLNQLLLKLTEAGDFNHVDILYISPMKALNYDIERNLEAPLKGIRAEAEKTGLVLPAIRAAVRTGDTPQKERQRMLRQPPHILITTPESLHLILTSTRARSMLNHVRFVIVDEIHALSGNKRGTFLMLLLERLQHLVHHPFTRIGLSATQKPLDKIAEFLGGYQYLNLTKNPSGPVQFQERPVHIIDAGIRKEMDLQILSPVPDMASLPDMSIWPSIYETLLKQVKQHNSTLIFANNRATVERITANINELAGEQIARAHHGSVSKEIRQEIELKLKAGELPCLVATATMELGIDMGAIDLVCQVESPYSVASGLQRVGRAGHLFGAKSKGRLLPKMRSDLLQMAATARSMTRGDVAPIKIPQNCLDVLAQQIVAMVAIQTWRVDDLFNTIRQAAPYQKLPRAQYLNVLEMLSGRYSVEAFRNLKPRISWDRVNQKLL
ncbi:DEAD/DEAH box helicase, partial [bacterium]|nr:DEAD/DEAH box helicase [bacterium]